MQFLSLLARIFRKITFSRFVPAEFTAGWGVKQNTLLPRRYASRHGIAYLALEDGFLRSVELAGRKSPPLSLVVDDIGIYYDATAPSRLENMLNGQCAALAEPAAADSSLRQFSHGSPLEDENLLVRAGSSIEKIVENHLSKYNASRDVDLGPKQRTRVLVIDQTAGDLSIARGLADADSFTRMLAAALKENPTAEIIVKIHPDVVAGKKQGHLTGAAGHPRVSLIDYDVNPVSLIKQVDRVYVVSSQTGFEALLAGKPVTCFGAPFYAGWGLTDDRVDLPRRSRQRSVEQLFAAAYILYARYRDPYSGEPCEIETVIDYLALQRRRFNENAGDLYCVGFSLWKRGFVRRYLQSPWNSVHFVRSVRQLPVHALNDDLRIVVWGRQEPEDLQGFSEEYGIPLWRIEDGFLRSVGLGSDLVVPGSLVVDKQGIYFDATRPSDLETLLQRHAFTKEELMQARALRKAIVGSGLSKYNVGQSGPLRHAASPGQRIILVPGQVEDDASIRLGCRDIRSNAALLRAVRAAAPEAYVIYKPHPDVLSGNRTGGGESINSKYYQQLVTDISIVDCLDAVDEVHTMTSLAGFEGLLRGKRVVTYGMPFYAGWGLTDDCCRCERRSRQLDLDELVAGSLLLYPRYLDVLAGFTSPEAMARRIERASSMVNNKNRIIVSRLIRGGRKLVNLVNGIFYAR